MSDFRYSLKDLLRVMERLRDPVSGCPWDVAQNFRSIVPSTLEECYELAQAIEQEDYAHVAEELGDVLFQVVFYAQLGREQSLFSFESVVDTLVGKLVRRHPHVFADGEIEALVAADERGSVEQIKESWETIKEDERSAKQQCGILADVPAALPALPRAQKLQKRAARVNFDWTDTAPVIAKLEEEMGELRQAMANGDEEATAQEMGDLLFTCVNLARHLGLDAETCLRQSSSKFEARFSVMEELAQIEEVQLDSLDAREYDAFWKRAKDRV
jgi:ATP diphosphatase